MRISSLRFVCLGLLASACVVSSGCAFSSTAKQWNTRLGPGNKPVFYKSTTKVGFNLLILIPFIGDLGIGGLVNDLTKEIKEEQGDSVRIVQGATENYWYGFPPFTWGLTPVISTVAAEYVPGEAALAEQKKYEETGEGGPRWYKPWSW